MKIVRATQTSMGCPSQWDAWDEDGNYYYMRYRHGCGQVRQYKSADWVDADEDELIRVVVSFDYGDPLAGVISLDEFAEQAGIELADDFHETNFGDHMMDEMITRGVIDPVHLIRGE